jgi:hypothetical protein
MRLCVVGHLPLFGLASNRVELGGLLQIGHLVQFPHFTGAVTHIGDSAGFH